MLVAAAADTSSLIFLYSTVLDVELDQRLIWSDRWVQRLVKFSGRVQRLIQ